MDNIHFTYDGYKLLIRTLLESGYTICQYEDWNNITHPAILRHDIDTSMQKAVDLAMVEKELGVSSTYFILLTTNFYNIASRENLKMAHKIIEMGHKIGLHFDEKAYPEIVGKPEKVAIQIQNEAKLLSGILDYDISVVSYHRPSKEILNCNLEIHNMINSYGDVFFHDFKYLSDSRRNWREPVLEIVKSKRFDKLHILTHAFWYNHDERDLKTTLNEFINAGNLQRWQFMNENLTDFQSVMPLGDIK